jgi:pimeloyl-ACP methyl ester carboxylesterase
MTRWREFRRDGATLRVRDFGGDGTPVVFLHGLAGHAGEWSAAASSLPGGFWPLALDQRGHASSERRPRAVTRAAYVDDVAALIRSVCGGEPAFLVGQSLGGHTALLAAAEFPELVRGLVAVEAGAGGPSPGLPEKIGRWLDTWPRPFGSVAQAVDFFGGGPGGEAWAAGLQQRDGGWWPRFDDDVMVAAVAELAVRSWWDEWDRISCPTLLVLGERGYLPEQEVQRMSQTGPGPVVAVLPGAGHDVHLEEPAAFAGLVHEFLVRATTGGDTR